MNDAPHLHPGTGRRPPDLIGRDEPRTSWATALARTAAGRAERSIVLYGPRGAGKTALLTDLASTAGEAGWVVGFAKASSGTPLRGILAEALRLPVADLARPPASHTAQAAATTFRSFVTSGRSAVAGGSGEDLTGDGGRVNSGALGFDLLKVVRDLTAATLERGVGLTVLIDDAENLTADELAALCSVTHRATQRNWPLLIALTGPPRILAQLAEAKSYAERLFAYHPVRPHRPDTRALVDPAPGQSAARRDTTADPLRPTTSAVTVRNP